MNNFKLFQALSFLEPKSIKNLSSKIMILVEKKLWAKVLAGIGVLSAVLIKVGIPLEGIGLIMGVDRLVDMGCTVVNVTGDLTGAVILDIKKKIVV